MLRSFIRLTLLLTGGFAHFAGMPAQAEPTVRGSWQLSCGPSVLDTPLAGATTPRLTFSQSGADSLARSYRLALEISAPDSPIFPDAWRFDAAGCQGPFELEFGTWIAAAIKTCPSNMPADPYTIGYGVALDEAGGRLRIEFHRDYYAPGPIAGSVERFLLALGFSHYRSVIGVAPDAEHCGGAETAMCIRLLESTYESFNGEVRSHVRLNSTYTVNAAAGGGECVPVPARASTWGAIKAQFR